MAADELARMAGRRIVVVGDVKTQQVLDEVAKWYTGTPRGRETYIPFQDEPEQLSPREAVRDVLAG